MKKQFTGPAAPAAPPHCGIFIENGCFNDKNTTGEEITAIINDMSCTSTSSEKKEDIFSANKNSHKFTSKESRVDLETTKLFPHLTLNETILNLKNIFGLGPDQKCAIRDNIIQVDAYYFQSIMRWLMADNRKEIIQFIVHVFDQACNYTRELIVKIRKCENEEINFSASAENDGFKEAKLDKYHRKLQGLITDMENSTKGLVNLMITYKNDLTVKNILLQQHKEILEHVDSTRRLLRTTG